MTNRVRLHASCVAVGGKGVLLLGSSGSGKSDLALRLIDRGARLVADDQVLLHRRKNQVIASAPLKLKGLLEVRGVGIVKLPAVSSVPVAMAVKLVPRGKVERLPEPQVFDCLGRELPLHCLHAFDRSAEAKIRICLGAKIVS